MREQSSEAERAVVAYKGKNNIVDTGGELMNEQQLAELNSDLIQARAATAEAKARFDRVQHILGAGDVDPDAASTATVADTLHNDVITKLREQYLEIEARKSLWAAKYGANHLAVVNLRNQMGELRRSIFEELKRTAQTYESDYEIAKKREESIQKSLSQTVSESQTTNEAQVTLHNLQSNAQTYRAIYDNFLQRYMESVQQQSFPISKFPCDYPGHGAATQKLAEDAASDGAGFVRWIALWRRHRNAARHCRSSIPNHNASQGALACGMHRACS